MPGRTCREKREGCRRAHSQNPKKFVVSFPRPISRTRGGAPEESSQSYGAHGKDDECCNGSRGIGSASDVKRDGGGSDWGVRRRRH